MTLLVWYLGARLFLVPDITSGLGAESAVKERGCTSLELDPTVSLVVMGFPVKNEKKGKPYTQIIVHPTINRVRYWASNRKELTYQS